MRQIRLARHLGVAPDWFDHQHPLWLDYTEISMRLERNIKRGPEIETWTATGAPATKPPILH